MTKQIKQTCRQVIQSPRNSNLQMVWCVIYTHHPSTSGNANVAIPELLPTLNPSRQRPAPREMISDGKIARSRNLMSQPIKRSLLDLVFDILGAFIAHSTRSAPSGASCLAFQHISLPLDLLALIPPIKAKQPGVCLDKTIIPFSLCACFIIKIIRRKLLQNSRLQTLAVLLTA